MEMLTPSQVHVRFYCFYISVKANSLITCLKPSPFVSAKLLCTFGRKFLALHGRISYLGLDLARFHVATNFIRGFQVTQVAHIIIIIAVGKREEEVDKVRSILAELEFIHTVSETTYLSDIICMCQKPEVHPETGNVFYEREP